jgi:tetratricopeptide (TPR) repeat protein
MNHEEAASFAAEALEAADRDDFERAEALYRRALQVADVSEPDTADMHGAYATVLSRLNRSFDATKEYERALFLQLRHYRKNETEPAVFVARYFLGEHYLRIGDADSARRTIAPSLEHAPTPLAWMVEAQALHLSGDAAAAVKAADQALALSDDEAQRQRIRERLSEVWDS